MLEHAFRSQVAAHDIAVEDLGSEGGDLGHRDVHAEDREYDPVVRRGDGELRLPVSVDPDVGCPLVKAIERIIGGAVNPGFAAS